MTKREYIGELNGGSLLIRETRVIVDYLLENPSEHEWLSQILDQNILQKKSRQTALRYARAICARLNIANPL